MISAGSQILSFYNSGEQKKIGRAGGGFFHSTSAGIVWCSSRQW